MLRFTAGLAGDPGIAEEVSQQTWLQVLEAIARGGWRPGAGTSFRAYLYTAARNRFIDDYRRRSAASRTESVPSPETLAPVQHGTDDVLDGAAAVEARGRLLQALAALPLAQREVIAFWSTGMSVDEVARLTGTSRNTVLSRKRYALQKLKQLLGKPMEAGIDD